MRRKLLRTPDPPTIEEAMAYAQVVADETWLGQLPFAGFQPGYGWWIGSTCHDFPDNAQIFYPVTVLPNRYFE